MKRGWRCKNISRRSRMNQAMARQRRLLKSSLKRTRGLKISMTTKEKIMINRDVNWSKSKAMMIRWVLVKTANLTTKITRAHQTQAQVAAVQSLINYPISVQEGNGVTKERKWFAYPVDRNSRRSPLNRKIAPLINQACRMNPKQRRMGSSRKWWINRRGLWTKRGGLHLILRMKMMMLKVKNLRQHKLQINKVTLLLTVIWRKTWALWWKIREAICRIGRVCLSTGLNRYLNRGWCRVPTRKWKN